MNKQTIQLMINKLHSLGYATLDRSKQDFVRFEDKARYLVFDKEDCALMDMINVLEDEGYTVSTSGDTLRTLTANLSTQEVLDKLNRDVEQVLFWALSHPDPMPVVSEPEPEPKPEPEPEPLVVYGVEYCDYNDPEQYKLFKTLAEAEEFADEYLIECMDEKELADMKERGLTPRGYVDLSYSDKDIPEFAYAFIIRHKL